MAASFLVLGALELVSTRFLRAVAQLVVQWVEQNLDECVCVVAVQFVLAVLPVTVVADLWAALRVVEEQVRRPTEVLLAMRIIAF